MRTLDGCPRQFQREHWLVGLGCLSGIPFALELGHSVTAAFNIADGHAQGFCRVFLALLVLLPLDRERTATMRRRDAEDRAASINPARLLAMYLVSGSRGVFQNAYVST